MTKQERDELRKMSEDAFGNPTTFEKLVKNGEYKMETSTTASGTQMTVKRWYPITYDAVKARMQEIIDKRNASKPEGGEDGKTEQAQNAQQESSAQQPASEG